MCDPLLLLSIFFIFMLNIGLHCNCCIHFLLLTPSLLIGWAMYLIIAKSTSFHRSYSKNDQRVVYTLLEYDPLLDSSNMTTKDWEKIGKDIEVCDAQLSVSLQHINYHAFWASQSIKYKVKHLSRRHCWCVLDRCVCSFTNQK